MFRLTSSQTHSTSGTAPQYNPNSCVFWPTTRVRNKYGDDQLQQIQRMERARIGKGRVRRGASRIAEGVQRRQQLLGTDQQPAAFSG